MPDEGLGVLLLIRMVEQRTPEFFRPDRVVHVARAPGRLDVIGGLGGGERALALQLPIAEAACVALQRRDDEFLRVWSPCRDRSRTERLSVRLSDLGLPDAPIGYDEARAFLCADPLDAWIAQVLGGLVVLARERGVRMATGFDLLVVSDIPECRGAGASAAVQVATLRALAAAFGLDLTADELVAVGRTVDREIAHDETLAAAQRTAVSARAGELAALRGTDGAERESIAVPDGLEFVGLELGAPAAGPAPDLAAVAAENERAERFAALLRAPVTAESRLELGELLFRSHECRNSVSGDREVADFIVGVARQRRAAGALLWGATMAGRGTVVVLGDSTKAWYEALRLKKALREKTGHSAHVFRWSSPGAAEFGAIELLPVGADPTG